ncbi:MAG: hypothetical protein ACREDT_10040 [Methylocella sp.]
MNMLFVRDFAGFFGGHLKYLYYMTHTAASELVEPVLYQTAHSRVGINRDEAPIVNLIQGFRHAKPSSPLASQWAIANWRAKIISVLAK